MNPHDRANPETDSSDFTTFADAATAGAASGGLMIVEIDGLYELARGRGPAAAEAATAHAERLLRLCLRQSDGLVSWGASEFLVLLSHADAAGLADLAELVVMAMRNQPIQLESGQRIHLSCSIGWSVFAWQTGEGHSWLGPIGEAGAALQAARELGGDCACGAPALAGLGDPQRTPPVMPAPAPHTARLLFA